MLFKKENKSYIWWYCILNKYAYFFVTFLQYVAQNLFRAQINWTKLLLFLCFIYSVFQLISFTTKQFFPWIHLVWITNKSQEFFDTSLLHISHLLFNNMQLTLSHDNLLSFSLSVRYHKMKSKTTLNSSDARDCYPVAKLFLLVKTWCIDCPIFRRANSTVMAYVVLCLLIVEYV